MTNKETINSLDSSKNQTMVDQGKKAHDIPFFSKNKQNLAFINQSDKNNTCLSKLANITFELAMTECFILLQKVTKK